MKNYKLALLAALGLASVTATRAATTDLLLGFNDAAGPNTAQNDYVIDLGVTTASLLSDAAAGGGSFDLGTVINTTTFNTAFGADGNAANNVAAGIVGSTYNTAPVTIATTGTSTPATYGSGSSFNIAGGDAESPIIGMYASSGQSDVNTGWTYEVATSPTAQSTSSTGLSALGSNPTADLTSGSLVIGFYEATRGGTGLKPTAGPFSQIGSFDINTVSGDVTFTAVPEPGTYGVLAAGGLLLLSLRRQTMNKLG